MTNLLPDTEKKRVRREYNTRRIIVIFIFMCVTGIIAGIALLPSYMHVKGQRESYSLELAKLEESATSKESQEYIRQLEGTNKMISILKPQESQVPVYVLIDSLLDGLVEGVRLNTVSYERKTLDGGGEGEGYSIRISINGVASDRDTLTALKQSMEEESYFDQVDLPISNFATRENIEFSMTLIGEIK